MFYYEIASCEVLNKEIDSIGEHFMTFFDIFTCVLFLLVIMV